MHAYAINNTQAMDLKDSREVYMRGFTEREGKEAI